jgi:hypothetical protein
MTTGLDTKILSVVFLRHGHALVRFGIIQLPVSPGKIADVRASRTKQWNREKAARGGTGAAAARCGGANRRELQWCEHRRPTLQPSNHVTAPAL